MSGVIVPLPKVPSTLGVACHEVKEIAMHIAAHWLSTFRPRQDIHCQTAAGTLVVHPEFAPVNPVVCREVKPVVDLKEISRRRRGRLGESIGLGVCGHIREEKDQHQTESGFAYLLRSEAACPLAHRLYASRAIKAFAMSQRR